MPNILSFSQLHHNFSQKSEEKKCHKKKKGSVDLNVPVVHEVSVIMCSCKRLLIILVTGYILVVSNLHQVGWGQKRYARRQKYENNVSKHKTSKKQEDISDSKQRSDQIQQVSATRDQILIFLHLSQFLKKMLNSIRESLKKKKKKKKKKITFSSAIYAHSMLSLNYQLHKAMMSKTILSWHFSDEIVFPILVFCR